ncbi:hypothetical protein NVV78_00940 [Pediococcus ethanolidurans]|uniref:hypothetical protein n=1 Tax=Pediococcus ethanolidurans TaxID=319653 RepID=UPI0021E95EE9|nr:hypothetical protein [Pediococcus ethanolidurans]MCV3314524.1 hypothetical protein [Pediococcus ethanolidurans]
MTKFVVKVVQGQSRTAGTKAKNDVVAFLNEIGYATIDYHVLNNKYLRVLFGTLQWRRSLKKIKPQDIVVYQYPAYSRFLGDKFIQEIKRRNAKAYIILHDVNSLRMYKESLADQRRELAFFENFDGIIAHNEHMKRWLREHGVNKPIVSLGIFDYVTNYPMSEKQVTNTVAYTGNLEKSIFLKKLKINTPIKLYGVRPQSPYPDNIEYRGSFEADKLGQVVNEGFGLVWDGESIDTCSGVLGEYLKFNNPHKTSFYLSKGMPVIIWSKAALADFVKINDCGITISSLRDLSETLSKLTDERKRSIKNNALIVGEKVRDGFFLKQALRKLMI